MIEQKELLGRLERVEKSRGGWTARCPAHDDQESSLFIWREDEVRWRLECCFGCAPEEIAAAIESAVSQLPPDQVVRYRYLGSRLPEHMVPAHARCVAAHAQREARPQGVPRLPSRTGTHAAGTRP